MTTTATRIAHRDDFEWLEPLPRYLSAQRLDPTGLPDELAAAMTAYNDATARATAARNAYGSLDERAFLAAIAHDQQADELAARAGNTDAPPSNTAGQLLDDRRRLHREAGTWTVLANQYAHDVVTLIYAHREAYAAALAPARDTGTAAAVKTARAALDKLRPTLAAADHANATAAWLRSVDSVDALTGRRRPDPADAGPGQAALDDVLRALDQLTP